MPQIPTLSLWAVTTMHGTWYVFLSPIRPRVLNVPQVRSEFDHMLLNHARSTGTSVYEQTKVESVSFDSADPSRPISVSWTHTPPPCPPSPPASPTRADFPGFLWPSSPKSSDDPEPIQGQTTFTHLIDATGRAGILSSRYYKNRHFNASLKNIAIWGYWRNVGKYGVGTARHGSPWFEALTGQKTASSLNYTDYFLR